MKRLTALLLALLVLCMGLARGERVAMDVADDAPLLRTVRIRAAGDIMVHSTQLKMARKSGDSYDFYPQFKLARNALFNADYTIASLITTIGTVGGADYSGYKDFNSPESLLDAIKNTGVDFLSLSNEHILDRGTEGLYQTVQRVEARGFDHGGANRSLAEKNTPFIVELRGIRIAILCYTQGTGGMERNSPEAQRYAVNYLTEANVETDISRAKAEGAEAIILVAHWGEEYKDTPDDQTVKLAKKLIAAGVDVILGSHAHVLQPVQYVTARAEDGTTRRGLVAYSLGSFINNLSVDHTETSIVLDFTLRETQDGQFEAVNVGAIPIYCWRQDEQIKAVPSMKYAKKSPEGMDSTRRARMRGSLSAAQRVMGSKIVILEE